MEWISYPVKDDSTYIKEYVLDSTAKVYKNLKYADESEKQAVDLYIPQAGQGPHPVIVYIHGGGFVRGDKTRHIMAMLQGLRYGYAVAAVNYRLADEAAYPAMLHDAATAIRFLKSIASEYDLNPDKFIVWGETHGAFLACQIGIGGTKGSVSDPFAAYIQYDCRVAGVVDYWAMTSLEEHYNLEKIVNKGKENPQYLEEIQFRAKGEELAEILRSSPHPLADIDGTEPPFYILHGEDDDTMALAFSQSYYYALKAAKDDVTLEILPGTGHGLAHIVRADQIEGTYRFIHRIFAR